MDDELLFAKYRETGDVAVRNQIVEKYLYIASVLAKKFTGRGVEYDDLFQVATLALIKGVDRFDETKGVKFSTFITPTVTGEIKNYFRDRSRLVHLPRKVAELKVRVKDAEKELTAENGQKPSAREIASRLGVTEEEVLSAYEAGGVVSLDSPAGEDGSFYDLIPSGGEDFERFENRDAVEAALKTLSESERALVRYRFGQELSQTETAKRMNVSQMYVSRLERKVLEKLKDYFGKGTA